MEPPIFYHYVKASGLIDAELLDDILQSVLSNDAAPRSSRESNQANTTETVSRTARLRGGIAHLTTGDDSQETDKSDTIDDADATLDGESGRAAAPRLTELDQCLAAELVQRGLLNHWQSAQLLEGRTKFTLGEFRVLDAIGKGGYGHVFLGRRPDRKMRAQGRTKERSDAKPDEERYVALKVLPLARATPELTERFLHEIDLQRNLSHENIVRFIDSGRDGNVDYMVHEFADGGDLKKLLHREGPLPFEIAAAIVSHLARAVQYLHEQGIVHRDIKPANVLLFSDGSAKLTDLGLAVRYDRSAILPHYTLPDESGVIDKQIDRVARIGGKVAGTVDYMSPDQIRNASEPLPAWDIYSLGCTLYQVLTGRVPYPKGNTKQKFHAHLNRTPTDPRVFNQSIPYDLVDLIRGAMAKDPNNRIRTAWEVADRLSAWVPPAGLAGQVVFQNLEESEREPTVTFFSHKKKNAKTNVSGPVSDPVSSSVPTPSPMPLSDSSKPDPTS